MHSFMCLCIDLGIYFLKSWTETGILSLYSCKRGLRLVLFTFINVICFLKAGARTGSPYLFVYVSSESWGSDECFSPSFAYPFMYLCVYFLQARAQTGLARPFPAWPGEEEPGGGVHARTPEATLSGVGTQRVGRRVRVVGRENPAARPSAGGLRLHTHRSPAQPMAGPEGFGSVGVWGAGGPQDAGRSDSLLPGWQ